MKLMWTFSFFLIFVCHSGFAAEEIERDTLAVPIDGREMSVDVFRPAGEKEAPLVVVVHGFTRNKNHMTGWGEKLAAEGFVVLIPTLPHLADHRKNANAIVQLVAQARDSELTPGLPKITRVALVGHSMGGLVTLLASSAMNPPVDAWVGLDPADFGDLGAAAAPRVQAQGLIFEAARDPFGLKNNRVGMLENYAGTIEKFKVAESTHGDAESNPDALVELAFGKTSPDRHAEIFEKTLAFLHAQLQPGG